MATRWLARAGALGGLALALAAWTLVGGPGVAAQAPAPIATTLVATQELSAVPPGRRWVVRSEHSLNAEHTHAGGFIYALRGGTVLLMEGNEIALQESQGIWVPEGVPHTHRAEAGSQLWTCTLESEAEFRAAPAVFASNVLRMSAEGPHLARLVSDQYQVGAVTAPHRHFGPEAVYVREGTYELNYAGMPQTFSAGQGYTVEPLTPHRLRNAGQDVARLFNLSLVPLGRQAAEPLPPEALR